MFMLYLAYLCIVLIDMVNGHHYDLSIIVPKNSYLFAEWICLEKL